MNESEAYKLETHSSYVNKNKGNDLLRPLKMDSEYKKDDLIKIHEFRRENIREPYKEIEGKNFFEFTNENDPKYKFINVQYQVRSNLLIKAIFWSFGIGCVFFAQRYFRTKNFINAIRWGGSTWSISMFAVWGSFELQPHLMGIFHSQYLRDLSTKDQAKYKSIGNLKQEEELRNFYYKLYGVNIKLNNNSNCEISKFAYDYDSLILNTFDYNPMLTQQITKSKKISDDDLFKEDFDENELTATANNLINDGETGEVEYDFSFHKLNVLGELCIIDSDKFLELETKNSIIDENKLKLIKLDVISNKNSLNRDTVDILKEEIIISENYLNGFYNNLNKDPEYKNY